MKAHFKISRPLLQDIKQDLLRPHRFAYERVGFIACKAGKLKGDDWVLLASHYLPVSDDDYVEDDSVGALIGSNAIRKMMQEAYDQPLCIVHVHQHEHSGRPALGITDNREMSKLIPNFWNVRPNFPHAAIVLSHNSMAGFVWDPESKEKFEIADFTVVGTPMLFIRD